MKGIDRQVQVWTCGHVSGEPTGRTLWPREGGTVDCVTVRNSHLSRFLCDVLLPRREDQSTIQRRATEDTVSRQHVLWVTSSGGRSKPPWRHPWNGHSTYLWEKRKEGTLLKSSSGVPTEGPVINLVRSLFLEQMAQTGDRETTLKRTNDEERTCRDWWLNGLLRPGWRPSPVGSFEGVSDHPT